jgi:cytochrome c-type protein NapB
MRGQGHPGLGAVRELIKPLVGALFAGALVLVTGAIHAQTTSPAAPAGSPRAAAAPQIVPRVTGAAAPMGDVPAQPFARPITDDKRVMRNYPEQPPVIPHSIENYQLTLKTNRCLECHRRQFTEGSGAPMISVTHFMDRDGQVLGDVTPRRYFCTACHVQQTDARPLVPNNFTDMMAPPAARN